MFCRHCCLYLYLLFMKTIYLLIIVFFCQKAKSQTEKVTAYFSKQGVLSSINEASYYRCNSDTLYFFRKYYNKTNRLFFEGKISNAIDSSDYNNIYSGICKWYYANGKDSVIRDYNDKGIKHGENKEFDESGTLRKHIVFNNGLIKDNRYLEFSKDSRPINVYFEDFKISNENWNLINNAEVSSKVKINCLEISNNSTNDLKIISPREVDSTGFLLEASLDSRFLIGKGRTGLIFNYKNDFNYSYFLVSKNRYVIGTIYDGKDSVSVENFFSKDLKEFYWNTLTISCVNDSMIYSINNKVQAMVRIPMFLGRKSGIYLSNLNKCFFDYFMLKQYPSNYDLKSEFTLSDLMVYKGYRSLIQSAATGLVINNQGYILAPYTVIKDLNCFFVYTFVDDTIQEHTAEVIKTDKLNNTAILKIKDLSGIVLQKPCYSFFKYRPLPKEEDVQMVFCSGLKKDFFNQDTISVKNTSLNEPIKLNNLFKLNVGFHQKLHGAVLFTNKGEFIGTVLDLKENNTNYTKGVMSYIFEGFLIHNDIFNINDIQYNPEMFKQNIHKNIVFIKSL